jgi:hypothetical protein
MKIHEKWIKVSLLSACSQSTTDKNLILAVHIEHDR